MIKKKLTLLPYIREWLMLCFTDAVIDLTMFSAAMIRTPENFSISCINGERNSAQAKLDIKKDNKILMFSSVPQYKMHKSGNKMVVARDFSRLENIGIFYCESSQDFPPVEKITMINNLDNGVFALQKTRLSSERFILLLKSIMHEIHV